MKALLTRFTLFLLVIFISIALGLLWILYTESGLKWTEKRISSLVTFEQVSGVLGKRIEFTNLDISMPSAQVRIDQGRLTWDLMALLSGELKFSSISLDDVSVTIRLDDTSEPSTPFEGIDSPLDVYLSQVELKTLNVISDEQAPIRLTDIHLAAALVNNELEIKTLALAHASGKLAISGDSNVGKADLSPTALQINWTLTKQNQVLSASGSISGDLTEFQLYQSIETPFRADISASIRNVVTRPLTWQVDSVFTDVPLSLIDERLNGLTAGGKINSSGSIADFGFKTSILAQGANGPSWLLESDIKAANDQLTIDNISLQQQGHETTLPEQNLALLEVTGTVNNIAAIAALDSTAIPLDVAVKWNNLHWPFASIFPADYKDINGQASVTGFLDDYRLNMSGEFKHKLAGRNRIVASGAGNRQSVNLTMLSSTGDLGSLYGSAQIDWHPSLNASAKVSFSNVNPGMLVSDWPGKLAGRARLDAGLLNDKYSARLAVSELSGSLRDRAISASMTMSIDDDLIQLNNAKVVSGSSVLKADGTLGGILDLSWEIDSPDLADFLPGLVGELRSEGSIAGSIDKPTVRFNADGQNIAYADWSIASIEGVAAIDLAETSSIWHAQWVLGNMTQGQQTIIDSARINVAGNALQHTLVMESSSGGAYRTSLSGTGRFQNQRWSAVLDRLMLYNDAFGGWSIDKPMAIALGTSTTEVSPFCLTNKMQQVCASVSKSNDTLEAEFGIKNLENAVLNPLLASYDAKLSGTSTGRLKIQQQAPGAAPSIEGNLQSTNSVFSYRHAEHPAGERATRELVIDHFRVAVSQTSSASANWSIQVAGDNKIEGRIKTNRALTLKDWRTAKIDGQAEIRINDLVVVPAVLIPDIDISQGRFVLYGSITGSIDHPILAIKAELLDTEIRLLPTGTVASDIDLNITTLADSSISLNGGMRLGEGLLTAVGQANFADPGRPAASIRLQGTKLSILNSPEMTAIGDLDLVLALKNGFLDLSGKVLVDKADITIGQPVNVIKTSQDVILEGTEAATSRLKYRINLYVDLGKQSKLVASGFEGNLDGTLRITQKQAGLTTGEGTIAVRDGIFSAYGQTLQITSGNLTFAGGALDNPALDLQAIKAFDGVKAGVSISGRARQPRVALYSEPLMSDRDILSYLIFDKPINQLDANDSIALVKIANSYRGESTGRLSQISKSISKTLGLSEFEVNAFTGDPNIRIGKNISSQFYIGYGYGLISAAQTLFLRYNINKAWSVQSDLGADSGADLRYQLEID